MPPRVLSLRTSSSVDLKSPYFESTLSSVTDEYEDSHNGTESLDMVPYNAYQNKFQQAIQSELSERFINKPLDGTLDDSIIEESFDFGHDTYENTPDNHHVLSTKSKRQSVPKCVFSLYVRMQLCTKMTLQQVSQLN